AIVAVRYAIEAQSAGGRSAALVKRGDEAVLARHLRHHLVIDHFSSPLFCCRHAPDFQCASARSRRFAQVLVLNPKRPSHAAFSTSEKCHVWTAPCWQGFSSRCSWSVAAMCSACLRGSHDRWP